VSVFWGGVWEGGEQGRAGMMMGKHMTQVCGRLHKAMHSKKTTDGLGTICPSTVHLTTAQYSTACIYGLVRQGSVTNPRLPGITNW
jgi:hypothetical protein